MSSKITFILGSMAGGGAERVASNLVDYYTSKKYNVQIILLLNDRIDYELPQEIELVYLSAEDSSKFVKPFVWIKKLRETLKRSKPDIVVSFFAKINLLVLIATFGLKIPVFISERNDPKNDGRGVFVKFLTSLLYPCSRGIIFQTNYAKKCFPKSVQKKSVVIPNPINIDFDLSKGKKLSKSIVSVGKLMKQKNHKLLINAFALISDKYPDYKLYIYGEGELREPLNKLIFEKELEEKVFLMGRTSDVFEVVYNADLFVLSSNYEGLSNALLEAMALGTPVITTNCAGSNEIIVNEKNGRIVETNNCKKLATAIEQTINDYDTSIKMAKKAKEQANYFSHKTVLANWDNFIT